MLQHPAIEMLPPSSLKPYPRNARTHSKKQVGQIAHSIERFGFTNPVLVDEADQIIAGQGWGLRQSLPIGSSSRS
jgi:ParB-like chromosome segregation protein Spo0J